MIFVFLGLATGFGGLLAIIFHFHFLKVPFSPLFDSFSEDSCEGNKCSGGRGGPGCEGKTAAPPTRLRPDKEIAWTAE